MQELSDKLRRGLQLAEQRLLEKNARHGKLLSQGARWKSDLRFRHRIARTLAGTREREKDRVGKETMKFYN